MKKLILLTLMIFTLGLMLNNCEQGAQDDGTSTDNNDTAIKSDPNKKPMEAINYNFNSASLNSNNETEQYVENLDDLKIRDNNGNVTPEAQAAWDKVINRGKELYVKEDKTSDENEELATIQDFFRKHNREIREEDGQPRFKIVSVSVENKRREELNYPPLSE